MGKKTYLAVMMIELELLYLQVPKQPQLPFFQTLDHILVVDNNLDQHPEKDIKTHQYNILLDRCYMKLNLRNILRTKSKSLNMKKS